MKDLVPGNSTITLDFFTIRVANSLKYHVNYMHYSRNMVKLYTFWAVVFGESNICRKSAYESVIDTMIAILTMLRGFVEEIVDTFLCTSDIHPF